MPRMQRLVICMKSWGTKAGTRSYFGCPSRERNARDLDQVRCIKDEKDRVLMDEAMIKRR